MRIVGLEFTLRSIPTDAGLNIHSLTNAEIKQMALQEEVLLDSTHGELEDTAEPELEASREFVKALRALTVLPADSPR